MQDLTRLLILVAVAETGSISRAAARLGYTPPALSQQMAKLEREVHLPLLVRHRRGARLTPAGEVLVRHARQVQDVLSSAERELAQLRELSGGRLRLGSFTTAGIHLLPPVLAELRRQHPGLSISLQEFEPPEGLEPLAQGHIDLLLTHSYVYGREHPMPPGLSFETLLEEELLLVAERGHPLTADPQPLHWTALAGIPLISGRHGLANREALEALFASNDLPAPTIAFETSNYSVACALAGEGMGLACVPRMAAEASPVPISTRPFAAPRLYRIVNIVWRTSDTSPLLHAARTAIQTAFTQKPPAVWGQS
ncbi:LysR family transcriptional regulator [Streptomyces sp. NPDC006368]|uniref:LysR family transcriptional regulator n=1 Tax=Streptomyces sp. NPDC006368 TaxID=3156760 RepID=UPI0033A26A2F